MREGGGIPVDFFLVHSVPRFLEILIVSVAFFLGHPVCCVCSHINVHYNNNNVRYSHYPATIIIYTSAYKANFDE